MLNNNQILVLWRDYLKNEQKSNYLAITVQVDILLSSKQVDEFYWKNSSV